MKRAVWYFEEGNGTSSAMDGMQRMGFALIFSFYSKLINVCLFFFCSETFTVTLRDSVHLVNGSNAQSAFSFGAIIPWCADIL